MFQKDCAGMIQISENAFFRGHKLLSMSVRSVGVVG